MNGNKLVPSCKNVDYKENVTFVLLGKRKGREENGD